MGAFHQHTHGSHTHGGPKQNYHRAFAIASSLNLAFVIIQIIAALSAHSMSLLADAVHNFSDVLALLLAWFAAWLAKKSSKARFSYGYKRTTILASLANGLILVAVSAIITYESLIKIFQPATLNGTIVILTAIAATIVNGGTAFLFLKDRHKDLNVKGAFLHLAADALISIGVAVSGVIILFTGWFWLDPLVGLLLVIVILGGTWSLLRDSISLILDAVPHNIDHRAVHHYLSTLSGVKEIHDLHIWGLSTTDTALTAHLVMPDTYLSDDDYQHINEELLHRFRINHVTLQIEKGCLSDPCGQAANC